MKRLIPASLLLLLASCGGSTDNVVLNVACAANMQFAMDSIAVLFEEEEGVGCEITAGSSGMLTSQIENGAPYDVFISANMKYPQRIFENGNGKKPVVYAKGRLVFVVRKNASYASIDEAFLDKKMARIAIADNHTAPYGMAANQYLSATGKKDSLAARLIIGESIGQVNQYLTTNAVDGGFTSYSFKVKNQDKYTYFEIDPDLFEPIEQGVMVLNHGVKTVPKETEKLLVFFETEKCKAVLSYFGYLTD